MLDGLKGSNRPTELDALVSIRHRHIEAALGSADLPSGTGDRRAINDLNRAIMQDKDSAVRRRAEKARRQIYAAMGRPR